MTLLPIAKIWERVAPLAFMHLIREYLTYLTTFFQTSVAHSLSFALVVTILILVMIVTLMIRLVLFLNAGCLSMAKGGYFVIGYPDNDKGKGVDINALQNAVEVTGGACLMILHDRDLKDDGTPKDNHYHVLIMWEKEVTENSMFFKDNCLVLR